MQALWVYVWYVTGWEWRGFFGYLYNFYGGDPFVEIKFWRWPGSMAWYQAVIGNNFFKPSYSVFANLIYLDLRENVYAIMTNTWPPWIYILISRKRAPLAPDKRGCVQFGKLHRQCFSPAARISPSSLVREKAGKSSLFAPTVKYNFVPNEFLSCLKQGNSWRCILYF
jgi:hypothetical protein